MNLTSDLKNPINIFLLSWRSIAPRCKISWCFRFSLSVYNVSCKVFLPWNKTTLNFDLRPSKTIEHLFSSWWSIVPSCMILELMLHSVSCLQRFPTMWQYNLDHWPPILKNDRHLPLFTVINCTMLYDPGAYGSFGILPTTFSYYVTIRAWPLTSALKNNRHVPLIMWSNVSSCKIL